FYFARRATGGAWRQAQNFVLRFDGPKPRKSDLDAFLSALPGQTGDSLPTLPAFLPENGRLAGSERFAVGPAGLAQAEPRLDPALALFDRGSEAAVAAYRDGVTLVVVGFPTPQIARQRLPEFEKVPGAVARRSGPLVALALGPPGPAAAVAASVQYQASVSWNQPTKDYFSTDVAGMLIGIFKLTGYILVFCLSAGLFMLGLRRLGRLLTGNPSAVEPMIVLDLKDK
ncbi:MAG TPA: hypothetical protein DEH78_17390, partial [Solibacterales bacterium]|nr:hypothetical protein [Bryobacterales bacterium]